MPPNDSVAIGVGSGELSRAPPAPRNRTSRAMSAVTSRIQRSAVLKATTRRGSSTRYTVPSRLSASGSIAARWCGAFGVLGDAAAQCLHEIDHPVRRGKGLPALWNGAGLLGLQMRRKTLDRKSTRLN